MIDFVKLRANSSIDNEEALLEAENGQVVQKLKRRDKRLLLQWRNLLRASISRSSSPAKGHVDHDLITWLQDVGDRARFRSFEFGGLQHVPLGMSPFRFWRASHCERFWKTASGLGKSSQAYYFDARTRSQKKNF